MTDITEIQTMYNKGDYVKVHNRARSYFRKLGEYELADAKGVVLETTLNANGQPVHLLLVKGSKPARIAESHLEKV